MLYQSINNDITIKQVINDTLARRKKSYYWLAKRVCVINPRRHSITTKTCLYRYLQGHTKSIHSSYLDDIFKVLDLKIVPK